MKHEELLAGLKRLNLATISQEYAQVARQCEEAKRTYEQYLAALVTLEVSHRNRNRIERLTKEAHFPVRKEIATYDFAGRTGITAQQVNRLASGEFFRQGGNVVLYGTFGVGKTHLAIGLGLALCEAGLRCLFSSTQGIITALCEAQKTLTLASAYRRLEKYDVLILDELGYTPQSSDGANLFFELISQRYERKSLIITTNLPYSEWEKVFLDRVTTAAAVDRIIHNCETFNIQGPSFRAEVAKKRGLATQNTCSETKH